MLRAFRSTLPTLCMESIPAQSETSHNNPQLFIFLMAVQLGTVHNEKKKKLGGHQKLLPLRPRRIVETSQLRAVQCRPPHLLLPNLELGTEGKGKYEEEKRKGKSSESWEGALLFISPRRCERCPPAAR